MAITAGLDSLVEFDNAHQHAFAAIQSFFRFERRHPDHSFPMEFDDAYYTRVAEAMKKRIDFEIQSLRSPHLL